MRGREHGAARISAILVLLLLVVVSVVLVGVSPLGLRLFDEADGDWERLSFIGQTYGAVSALIAVLALVGVAVTLFYQARESRRAVDETRRQAMSDLLRMAMDDPELDECWGPVPPDEDPKVRKQQLYTNMIVTQWGTAFRAGAMPEKRLKANATEMFQGPAGRAYWSAARASRLDTAGRRSERRFNEVLDEAYHDAAAVVAAQGREVPTRPPEGPALADADRRSRLRLAAVFTAGVAAGAAAGVAAWAGSRLVR